MPHSPNRQLHGHIQRLENAITASGLFDSIVIVPIDNYFHSRPFFIIVNNFNRGEPDNPQSFPPVVVTVETTYRKMPTTTEVGSARQTVTESMPD